MAGQGGDKGDKGCAQGSRSSCMLMGPGDAALGQLLFMIHQEAGKRGKAGR